MRRLLIAFALFLPIVLGAQDIPPGTMVRVVVRGQRAMVGIVRAFSADSIHVTTLQGAHFSHALGNVRRIDRNEGRTTAAGARKGMMIGAIVGGVSALGTFLSSGELGGKFFAGAFVGALVGGVRGAITGADRWTAVSLPVGGRLSLMPMPAQRVGVAVTYAF